MKIIENSEDLKFSSGEIFITKHLQDFFKSKNLDVKNYLDRHFRGDWGDLCKEDERLNEEALISNDRILSAYQIGLNRIYIITEADRSMTTVMFCEEY